MGNRWPEGRGGRRPTRYVPIAVSRLFCNKNYLTLKNLPYSG